MKKINPSTSKPVHRSRFSNSRELLRRILATTRINNAARERLSRLSQCRDALRCAGIMEGAIYDECSQTSRLLVTSTQLLKTLRADQTRIDGSKFNAKRNRDPRTAFGSVHMDPMFTDEYENES